MRGTIDMIVLEKCSADFFILDDSKYLKLDKSEQSMIFRFMEYLDKKRISVKIITIDELDEYEQAFRSALSRTEGLKSNLIF